MNAPDSTNHRAVLAAQAVSDRLRPLLGGCVQSIRAHRGSVIVVLERRPLDSEAALIPPSMDGIPVRTRIVGTLINGKL